MDGFTEESPQKTLDLLRQAHLRDPNSQEIDLILACMASLYGPYEKKLHKAGVAACLRVLKASPDDLDALGILGHLYTSKRQWEKAILILEHLVSLDPTYLNCTFLIDALFQAERPEEAFTLAQERVTQVPVDGHRLTAFALQKLGRLAEAIQELKLGLDIAPKDPTLWGEIGDLYRTHGASIEAHKAYQRAIELAEISGWRQMAGGEDWIKAWTHDLEIS